MTKIESEKMGASYPTKLILAFKSGNKCALPDCGRTLIFEGDDGDPINIGKAAHIEGENDGAARYRANMTPEERDDYKNLIYLCGVCHDIIDDKVQGAKNYPVPRLHQIKNEHERKLMQATADAFADVGFPELEEATRWVLSIQPAKPGQDFTIIPPEDKLKKNNLGSEPRAIITMGLSLVREVGDYIKDITQTNADFPERLKSGFLTEYYRLKHEGHKGDNLFDLMCRFAQRGFEQQAKRNAGIAVLVYLFENCEVFEK